MDFQEQTSLDQNGLDEDMDALETQSTSIPKALPFGAPTKTVLAAATHIHSILKTGYHFSQVCSEPQPLSHVV